MNDTAAARSERGEASRSRCVDDLDGSAADDAAFEALYRAHYTGLYGYNLARTRDEQDAADLTQQVFVQALRALPEYEDRGVPIAAWLYRIARNLVTDHYRRGRTTVAWESIPESGQPAAPGDPEEDALRREAVARLRGPLSRLSPERRELLALRFGAELRTSEIAHALGRSEGAVKTELRRTLLALREDYDED